MMRAIRKKASAVEGVRTLYGMGSFFYHTHFNDVDLVAVVDCSKDQLLNVANEIQKSFELFFGGETGKVIIEQ